MESIDEALNGIALDSARFILEQAEKRATATIEVARSLTEKAVHVMQFSIPLSIALIGLIVIDPKKELLWFYVAVLIVSVTTSYISLRVYEAHDLEYSGYKPSQLLNSALFEQEDQHVVLMMSVIKDLEERIDVENRQNHDRERLLTSAVLLVKALLLLLNVLIAMDLVFPMIWQAPS